MQKALIGIGSKIAAVAASTALVLLVSTNIATANNNPTSSGGGYGKDQCKNGGWQDFTGPPGPFKNQGDCVSYFATGGRNPGNGH